MRNAVLMIFQYNDIDMENYVGLYFKLNFDIVPALITSQAIIYSLKKVHYNFEFKSSGGICCKHTT